MTVGYRNPFLANSQNPIAHGRCDQQDCTPITGALPPGGPPGHRAANPPGDGPTDQRSHTDRPSSHREENRRGDGDHQTGGGGR